MTFKGEALLEVLERQTKPVEIRDANGVAVRSVMPGELTVAVNIAKYQGAGHPKRIRFIRPLPAVPLPHIKTSSLEENPLSITKPVQDRLTWAQRPAWSHTGRAGRTAEAIFVGART